MAALAFDQNSIALRILSYLETLLEADGRTDVKTFYYGAARRLIDAISEELANEVLYDEYLTREAKWKLAQNLSSLMAQVQFFSYRPHRMVGAQGPVRVSTSPTFDGSWPQSIPILRWDSFSNGDKTFICTGDPNLNFSAYSLPAGVYSIDVNVVEGKPVETTFEITSGAFPEGTSFASLTVHSSKLENRIYDVLVNGVLWSEVDYIRLAKTGSDLVYATKSSYDFSSVAFMFGDGVFGQSLKIGDVVTIRYVDTDGADGNVDSTGNVTIVEGSHLDTLGNQVTLFCTNPANISGGDGYEDIETIRVEAPLSYQTGNRAITANDYKALLLKSGIVDNAVVWGEAEINEDLGLPAGTYILANEDLVYISGYKVDNLTDLGLVINSAQQSSIRSVLSDVKGVTDILQFVDADFIYLLFSSTIYISDVKFSPGAVAAAVKDTLSQTYSIKSQSFFKSLYHSQYETIISKVSGVDHHVTTLSFLKLFGFDDAYTFQRTLGLANIKPGSVLLYIKGGEYADWTQMAHDVEASSSLGNFVAEAGFTITGATVAYANGDMGTVIVTGGLAQSYLVYQVKAVFKINNSDDAVLIKRQQVLGFYDAAVTPIQE